MEKAESIALLKWPCLVLNITDRISLGEPTRVNHNCKNKFLEEIFLLLTTGDESNDNIYPMKITHYTVCDPVEYIN